MGTYELQERRNYYEFSPFRPLVCEMCDQNEKFHVSFFFVALKTARGLQFIEE